MSYTKLGLAAAAGGLLAYAGTGSSARGRRAAEAAYSTNITYWKGLLTFKDGTKIKAPPGVEWRLEGAARPVNITYESYGAWPKGALIIYEDGDYSVAPREIDRVIQRERKGNSARGRRAYGHAGSPELPRTLAPHDAHAILKHYPLMEGNHPEIRYQVNSGLSAPSSSKRGLMGSPRRLFLNFDRDGELLGYNYIDSRTKLPFNTAADGSVIGLTGGKIRFGSTKWEETKGKRGKARPKLFIASLFHADYHPDYNEELAAEFGGRSRAIKGSIRDSDYYKYNWRAAWAALHAGAIPTMKDMNKARGTANKRGQR